MNIMMMEIEDYSNVCALIVAAITPITSISNNVDIAINDIEQLKDSVNNLGDAIKKLNNKLAVGDVAHYKDNIYRGIYLTSKYKTLNYQYKFRI